MVAEIVWRALGQPKSYIEPFAGSCAVLLARPDYNPTQHIETINDKDGFICNIWRSLQFNPDEVAKWCDWPVSHIDLSTRKIKLIENEKYLLDGLKDPDWYDAKLAGYWIWAASCWIGSGLTRIGQIPYLISGGVGVHKIGQIPHLISGGMGVQEPYNTNIYKWFRDLSQRLRHVRSFCGDWKRVCGGDWQDKVGIVGIFFDPPYGVKDRNDNLYRHDSTDLAHEVRNWCIKRGSKETYRIVLAGYDEHKELLSHGWTMQSWSAGGGYSNLGKKGNSNRHREALYFSPHCVQKAQGTFFDEV